MAQRRTLSMKVIDSDEFLDLPMGAQALYFHLAMRADDDGFLGSAHRVTRLMGGSPTDLSALIQARFLLLFPSGVTVIRHWGVHFSVKKDRYHPTVFADEMACLMKRPDGTYAIVDGLPNETSAVSATPPSQEPFDTSLDTARESSGANSDAIWNSSDPASDTTQEPSGSILGTKPQTNGNNPLPSPASGDTTPLSLYTNSHTIVTQKESVHHPVAAVAAAAKPAAGIADSEAASQAEAYEMLEAAKRAGFSTSGSTTNRLLSLMRDYGKSALLDAIGEAADHGSVSPAYLRSILQTWQKNGGRAASQAMFARQKYCSGAGGRRKSAVEHTPPSASNRLSGNPFAEYEEGQT